MPNIGPSGILIGLFVLLVVFALIGGAVYFGVKMAMRGRRR